LRLPNRRPAVVLVALATGLGLIPIHLSAEGNSRSKPQSRSASKIISRKSHHRKASVRSRRNLSSRQRLARIRLQPDRVQEIQRALVQAGYLNEGPNGRWDEQTRDAMRHYQADSGFQATGLPEAKSLMKLGLGPHALPPELDRKAMANARRTEAAKNDPRGVPPPSSADALVSDPSPQNQP
jgi:peptidoglycan hydrolase-like protein with peptidoglycan-binding domain